MQLRNGKTMTQIAIKPPACKEPEQVEERVEDVVLFMREAKTLLDELNEWDVLSARLGGLLEFYEYIIEFMPQFKDDPKIASFVASIKVRVPAQFEEFGEILKKHAGDEDMLNAIDKLTHAMLCLLYIVR